MAATERVDLELLRIFVAVAELSSFTKAATHLGITKGTVSRGIARLEEIIGADLLHRDTHRVTMSTAGTELFERAAPHLAALASAVLELPDRGDVPSGQLRITAVYDFGVQILPSIIAAFSLRNPQVSFDVQVTNEVRNLVADRFDLSIRAAARGLTDSTLTARKLGAPTFQFFASPSYLARRGEPREYGDGSHDWIGFGPLLKFHKPPIAIRFLSSDVMFIRSLLLADAGVGQLPSFVAEDDVLAGRLVQVLPSRTVRVSGGAGYYLLYSTGGQPPRRMTAFRDFLIKSLKAKPLG